MRAPTVATVDFETKAIEDRPRYPPEPVGVSIILPGQRSAKYYGWGHPTGNNCTFQEAQAALEQAWRHPLLFHNGKFDVDVAVKHMGVPMPSWDRIHDTMFLLFLDDPHQRELSLKPASARLLDMPPDEQEEVRDWLYAHGVVRKGSKWGAFIAEAPGDLVGRYANGDTTRTLKLFKLLYSSIDERGMLGAYNREQRLMPILLKSEQAGLRVDSDKLYTDIILYQNAVESVENWLRKRLGVPDLDFDKDRQVGDALESSGVVTDFVLTATGQKSVAKDNLTADMFHDPRVASALGYRNRLVTCLGTFMEPWLALAGANGGRIHTTWNQVRQDKSKGGQMGTRTGRLSSSPNFQNIPKSFADKNDGYVHPKFLRSLPELPLVRRYILPEKGHTLLHRDFNGQELRILGHFEDGEIMRKYIANPRMDIHEYVRQSILEISGIELNRSQTKIMNFGMMYGMGLGKLAEDLGVNVDMAKKIKAAQLASLPGLKALDKGIKDSAKKEGLPIVTWGGRVYHSEPAALIKGRMVSFEYKLLNYLIQGSAADCTKEAVIRYDDLKRDGEFRITVHDEINATCPTKKVKSEMKLLKEAMEGVAFDVPMLSDGKTGATWGDLTKYED